MKTTSVLRIQRDFSLLLYNVLFEDIANILEKKSCTSELIAVREIIHSFQGGVLWS